MKLFPAIHWLVVDDSAEDAADIALAIEGLGGKADIADNLKAAEKFLRKNIYDVCVIDCFYKGSTKWGVDLLPELRQTLPGLPVVMTSNSDDVELPGKVIRAGADAFCPKLRDSFSLMKALFASSLQAIAVRRLKMLEYQPRTPSTLFLSKKIADLLEHSTRRKEERLLLCGATGSGKTQVAQHFAQQYLKHNFGTMSRNIVYHNCSAHNDEENFQTLFGTGTTSKASKKNANVLQLTIFERAVGGILVLDDIQALSAEIQSRLKVIFDNEMVTSPSGDTTFPLHLTKCVATYCTNASAKVIPGLLEAFAHREIDLPNLHEMGPDIVEAVRFIAEHINENNDLKVTYTAQAMDRLVDLASGHSFAANFRSLRQVIEAAINRALSDRRSYIYDTDILTTSTSHIHTTAEPGTDKESVFENRYGESLIRLIKNAENFDGAKEILRKIMVTQAMKKFENNKTKVAASLGVSRQSLYDHDEEGVSDAET